MRYLMISVCETCSASPTTSKRSTSLQAIISSPSNNSPSRVFYIMYSSRNCSTSPSVQYQYSAPVSYASSMSSRSSYIPPHSRVDSWRPNYSDEDRGNDDRHHRNASQDTYRDPYREPRRDITREHSRSSYRCPPPPAARQYNRRAPRGNGGWSSITEAHGNIYPQHLHIY